MPRFVSEGVERVRQAPDEGSAVALVVRLKPEALPRASQWIEDRGGRVTDSMSHRLLELTLPEVRTPALCELERVRSVERADGIIEASGLGD